MIHAESRTGDGACPLRERKGCGGGCEYPCEGLRTYAEQVCDAERQRLGQSGHAIDEADIIQRALVIGQANQRRGIGGGDLQRRLDGGGMRGQIDGSVEVGQRQSGVRRSGRIFKERSVERRRCGSVGVAVAGGIHVLKESQQLIH